MEPDDSVPHVVRDSAGAPELASVFGRAFIHEPMMCWPMGSSGDLAQRFTRCFAYFLEMALPLGLIWAAGQADGLAVWVAPEHRLTWALHPWDQPQILSLADDGGVRYQTFWDWVAAHEPTEPLWQLDSIAVEPGLQGRGIGKALIEAGLARASADRTGAYLSTGTAENVAIYRHCGFRVYDEADAPDEGPHIWFMRWDP